MSEMADVILKADKFQTHSPDALRCPVHDAKMWAHGSGSALLCVEKDQRGPCGEGAPITSAMLDAAREF